MTIESGSASINSAPGGTSSRIEMKAIWPREMWTAAGLIPRSVTTRGPRTTKSTGCMSGGPTPERRWRRWMLADHSDIRKYTAVGYGVGSKGDWNVEIETDKATQHTGNP